MGARVQPDSVHFSLNGICLNDDGYCLLLGDGGKMTGFIMVLKFHHTLMNELAQQAVAQHYKSQ